MYPLFLDIGAAVLAAITGLIVIALSDKYTSEGNGTLTALLSYFVYVIIGIIWFCANVPAVN